jgi:glycosyltransferase involved in cell wall biosynthesis
MISYGCSPIRGGEHLLGWEWATRLAKRGHRVSVLTAGHRIAEGARDQPPGMTMIPVEDAGFAQLRRTGMLGAQLYYQFWVRAAWRAARRIVDQGGVDVVHQCTFHTYRWGFGPALWGDVASVWGPLAGLEHIPWRFLPALGWHSAGEVVRAVGDSWRKRLPLIRRSLAAADHVIVSNTDTERELLALHKRHYEYVPANAVQLPALGPYTTPPPGRLDIVAVGSLVAMRPYQFVIDAIAAVPAERRHGLTLTFIGGGATQDDLKARVKRLALSDCVRFLGDQTRETTLARMRNAHLLVFPSLRDSGSSSVAEAMAMGLPVLGLDLAGSGAMLIKGGGLVIRARTPATVTAELRTHIERLLTDPSELTGISATVAAAARSMFDWDERIERLETLYLSAIERKRQRHAAA